MQVNPITVDAVDIVVPYSGAERLTPIWAEEERRIDFHRDRMAAARCTTAFAAMELKRYLSRTLPHASIRIVQHRSGEACFIELRIADERREDESFVLERSGNGIVIAGAGRAGVLYGTYELLRLQGWHWYAPGESGEIVPEPCSLIMLPETKHSGKASMDLGRGFDFEYVSEESESFFLWMARNRLNVAAYRDATAAFCRKLGMTFKVGGHIFEALLDPARFLPSGRTLWEQHPEWYGLPESGIRRKEEALRTQFCVSRPDLIEFLGQALTERLQRDWRDADRVDLWGFDTWGKSCMCADCRKLGNSADQLLHFVSGVRSIVNRAIARGEVNERVRLIVCGYEGTDTLHGPSAPVPANLTEAGDLTVYYPINRCYAHDMEASGCRSNERYHGALQSWTAHAANLPVVVGEYYNVSKFEDLPLLFTARLSRDIPAYRKLGVSGMTYMHVPLVNWGMRTLTQVLYAQLCWDADTDTAQFLEEYFANWYGPHAARLREAYEAVERAWESISDWRSWKKDSVLSLLLRWDGGRPSAPLAVSDHFGDAKGVLQAGRASLQLLETALRQINAALAEDRSAASLQAVGRTAVNPVEARKQAANDLRYEHRLGEDRRLLLYGIDTLRLQVAFVSYYTALYEGGPAAAEASWTLIEQTAERMDSYFIPIGFEQPGAGLESKDALTRSQLRGLIRRCRAQRADAT